MPAAGPARPLAATVAARPRRTRRALLPRPPGHALPASLPDLSVYPSALTVSVSAGRVSIA